MSNELRRNSIGFWGVVFYAVSVIFPAGAFAITGVAAMTYAGETAPLAFLIGGITLFLAIIPVYVFSSRISNAGGYYKFVEAATQEKYISKSVGFWHAFWIIGDMIAASIIVGWFTWVGLSSLFGYNLPFYMVIILSFIVPILYLIVGYFGIKFASWTAILIGLIQIVFFTSVALMLILKTHYNGIQYFNVSNSINGLYGFFLAMVVGAFLAYGGYGSVVSLGEEARLSKTSIKKAIIVALVIMVTFDTLVVYSIVAAAGPNLSQAISTSAPGLYEVTFYYGTNLALVAFLLVVIAQIFSPVIFGNSGARTLFSLARDGLLPKSLSKVHEKYKSPHIATLVVFFILIAGILLTLGPLVMLYGESNGSFFAWVIWGTAITIFTLLYHIVVNQTLPLFLRRIREKFDIIKILYAIVAPTIASVIMIIAIYYSLAGLAAPLNIVYIMIPSWIVISLVIIHIRRNKTAVEHYMRLTE
jgi:Amino acid transporters